MDRARKVACVPLLVTALCAAPRVLSQPKGGALEWPAHFEDDAYFEDVGEEESGPQAEVGSSRSRLRYLTGARLRFKPAADVYFNMVTHRKAHSATAVSADQTCVYDLLFALQATYPTFYSPDYLERGGDPELISLGVKNICTKQNGCIPDDWRKVFYEERQSPSRPLKCIHTCDPTPSLLPSY